MTVDMRLRFDDVDLKVKLQSLAADAEISLNQLVNLILTAQFDAKVRKSFDMLLQLVAVKRIGNNS